MYEEEAISLYKQGFSSIEIAIKSKLSPRTVQRLMKREGITRNPSDRFKNAIKRGRMIYERRPLDQLKHRKQLSSKLRYTVLSKYNSTCVTCGNTSKNARIQIDHIDNDPSNNAIDNLQVLCEPCNKGKFHYSI